MLGVEEIRRTCGDAAFERGRRYFSKGHVLEVLAHEDDETVLLRARVAGTRSSPYEVSAVVDASDWSARGFCSCPMQEDCKHVAAVLLKYRAQLEAGGSPAGLSPRFASEAVTRGAESDQEQAWHTWLERVESEEDNEGTEKAKHHHLKRQGFIQAIHYVLSPIEFPGRTKPEGLRIEMRRSERKMSGGWKKGYPVRVDSVAYSNWWVPEYADVHDVRIASLLCAEPQPIGGAHTLGSDRVLSSMILSMVLETGRVWWEQVGELALSPTEAQEGRIAWSVDSVGTQTLDAFVAGSPKPIVVVDLGVHWQLDLENGALGPLRFDVPEPVVRKALASPALPAALSRNKRLRKRLESLAFAPPRVIEVEEVKRASFTVELRLLGLEGGPRPDSLRASPAALLRCRCDGHPVALAHLGDLTSDSRAPFQSFADGKLIGFARDRRRERTLARALDKVGLQQATASHEDGLLLELPPPPRMILPSVSRHAWMQGWIDLPEHPALRDCAFINVVVEPSFPLQVVDPGAEAVKLHFESDADLPSDDWFGVGVGIDVEGHELDLVPILLSYLRSSHVQRHADSAIEKQDLLLPLDDGRLLRLDTTRFGSIFRYLLSLFEHREPSSDAQAPLRLRATALELVPLLEAAESEGLIDFEDAHLPKVATQLREFVRASRGSGIQKIGAPPTLKAELRGYQREGLRWLQNLHRHGLSGLLADDMGLGKTVQAIAHLLTLRRRRQLSKPALIVCPTSVLPNWKAELARFAPSLRVVVQHGPERHATRDELLKGGPNVVLTSYPILLRDHEILVPIDYSVAVLDESQTIKNAKAKISAACYALRAEQKVAMSGTPIENHLGELWSVFRFLEPALFGGTTSFRRRFQTPIEKHGDPLATEALQARIRPFVLRRRKEDVAKELPPKVVQTRFVELGRKERDLYETVRASMAKKVRQQIAKQGLGRSQILFLEALLKLRQVCCDPRLTKKVSNKHVGSKLKELFSFLSDLLAQGRRVLLFSQFTSMLALIEEELRAHGIAYAKLTGATRKREQAIAKFRNGEAPLFLISLKAGGTGLNLVEADTVIHYDPWWNPAVEEQATDRAHRIGQTQSVNVYRLVAQGTVEERILALQERKRAIAGIAEQGAATSSRFTEADVEALLRPM